MSKVIEFKSKSDKEKELTELEERDLVATKLEILADHYREGLIYDIDMIFNYEDETQLFTTRDIKYVTDLEKRIKKSELKVAVFEIED